MRISDFLFDGGGKFSTKAPYQHQHRPKGCPTNELILVTRGHLYLQVGEERHSLSANDYLLIPPHTGHRGWKQTREPVEYYWLHFYGEPLQGCGTLPAPSTLIQNAQQLLQIQGSPAYPKETVHHMLAVLLAELEVQKRQEAPQNALAARVHEYVRSHSKMPLTAAGVAESFGFHPDHLSRVMKNCYGLTLKQEIARERLERAKHLLQTTDWTVTHIALELGWQDANLFEKFFRYHLKTTPTAYRNSFFEIHTNYE